MTRKTRKAKDIARLTIRMYPPKPWVNPYDFYGRRKHQELKAMGSGVVRTFSGMTIVTVH